MKKVLAIFLAAVMALSFSVMAFAAPGSFVQSPSRNDGPTLVEGENESSDCTAKLVVTPYKDRKTLPQKALADIEKAYQIISNCTDITSLCAPFASFVSGKGIPAANLAVSDLFDISYYGCNVHDYHKQFTFTIKADTLKNFVGLLHFHNGEWDFIENAKLNDDGTITFTVEDFSPFAIIVDTGAADAPTGDVTPWIFIALIVASATALTVVAYNYKKEKAKA